MSPERYFIEVAAVSSVGLRRALNEDGVSVNGEMLVGERVWLGLLDEGPHLLLLADGMGGHAKGEVASRLALEFLNRRAADLCDPSACIEAIRGANRHVFDAARDAPERAGMGSTVVGARLLEDRLIWFNVGDSRAYHWRAGALVQLSVDHVPSGATGPRRSSHAITQSLGGTYRPVDVWPAIGTLDWSRGDRLLLCSDGLTDVVGDEDISALLSMSANLEDATVALLGAALQRGAPDNVSVLLAQAA